MSSGTALPRLSPDFLWGTATSAHQVEGGNDRNDWSDFEKRFTPSGRAADFARLFAEDLDRARELGTNSFRFSLEWSRVEPRPGETDASELAYYDALVNACRARGLRPLLTLVQFTLPRWAAQRSPGGWLDREVHEAFGRHVRRVAERFGDRIDLFVTFNEPNVLAGAGHIAGVFPPGKRFRFGLANRYQVELLRAHARAYEILHDVLGKRGRTPKVGISPHIVSWQPTRADLAGSALSFGERFNWAGLDALQTGTLNLPGFSAQLPEVKGRLDFVGLNYFMSMPAHLIGIARLACLLRKPIGAHTSDNGWPVDLQGLESAVREAYRRYRMPILITENGIADATDEKRPTYLIAQLLGLQRAVAAGADVQGYFHWSLIDNFEWHEGFAPRFGLYAVDYETQKRTARRSCELYRRIIAAGGVPAELASTLTAQTG